MSGHGFPNVFQIFNLNKNITAKTTSPHLHTMDYHGNEREDS